jgi:hypothetical protein
MVLLADNEPETFQMYAVLSYNGSVASRGLPYEWQSLVEVYVKAESLVDTWAKNRIIDAMHSFIVQHIPKAILTVEDIRVFGEYFSVAALASLYNGTPVTSQARELVIDLLADNVSAGWVRSKSSLLPQEFLVDLTVRLLNKRSHDLFNNMDLSALFTLPREDKGRRIESERTPASEDRSNNVEARGEG